MDKKLYFKVAHKTNDITTHYSYVVLREGTIVRNKKGQTGRNAKIRIMIGPTSLYGKPEQIYSEQQNEVKVLCEVVYNIGHSKKKGTRDYEAILSVKSLFYHMRKGTMSISAYQFKEPV